MQLVHDAVVAMPVPLHAVVDDVFNRICRVNTGMDVDGGEEGSEVYRKRTRAQEGVAIPAEETNTAAMALTHITNILTRNAQLESLKVQEEQMKARNSLSASFDDSSGTPFGVADEERTRLLASRKESMTALQNLVGYVADPPLDLAEKVQAKRDAFLTKRAEEAKKVFEEREERAKQARVAQLSRGGAQSQQGFSANSVQR